MSNFNRDEYCPICGPQLVSQGECPPLGRCTAVGPAGIRCAERQGHEGPHSATLDWGDAYEEPS